MQKPFVIFFCLLFSIGCAQVAHQKKNSRLYQVSTLQALIQGVYDGPTTIKDLKQHGDMGIGTFNRLDGEMVAFDNDFYQVKANGSVVRVREEMKTPFASVTFFGPTDKEEIIDVNNLDKLHNHISEMIPSGNYFFAIRVRGLFDEIKLRSVPAQKKPYRPLTEVVKGQKIFNYRKIQGSIVGFFSPMFVKDLRVAGYHLHFLSKDRTKGGHVLNCRIKKAVVELQRLNKFLLCLPKHEGFSGLDLKETSQSQIDAVEKEKISRPKE